MNRRILLLRLIKIRDNLADSFWFIPALMAGLAALSALGSVALDHALGADWINTMGWIWSGGPDGARGVMSIIAGSLMTVISIVFSLTVTTLAQTSAHFGPRVLRKFTSDRGVQLTLGTFIATFVYCLLVLRTVRSVEESEFVPYLSINIGMSLSLVSLVVLIYFIHHISQTIQAEYLIADVGNDFQQALPELFPAPDAPGVRVHRPDPELPSEEDWQDAACVRAIRSGYLQRLDEGALMRLAQNHHLLIRLNKRPGEFVGNEALLLRVLPIQQLTTSLNDNLRNCFVLGRYRTPYQDALYSIQQLVEIALRALSPGINEPYTALTCIDWLGTCLRGVASRELPHSLHYGADGELRMISRALVFEDLARTAFDQIRLYGASNPDVARRLLAVIAELAPDLRRKRDREVLIGIARQIGEDAAQIHNETDRGQTQVDLHTCLKALKNREFPET